MNDIDKLLVTLKSIFSEFLDTEYSDVDISYNDMATKDGRLLSPKQWICLFRHFDCDLDITKDFIITSTYLEVSETIGKILRNRPTYYNYKNEDFGDRV